MVSFQQFKQAVGVILIDKTAIEHLASDTGATQTALLILGMSGVAMTFWTLDIIAMIMAALSMILGFFIFYSLFHFVAHRMGGKATGAAYFRPLASSFLLYFLFFLPVSLGPLGDFFTLWLMAVNAFVIHYVHKLPLLRSVLSVVIALTISFLMVGFFMTTTGYSMM